MRPAAARVSTNIARTLMLKSRSKSPSVVSASDPNAKLPALLTSTSSRPANRPPNAASSCAMRPFGPSSTPRSAPIACAASPVAAIAAATASAASRPAL
jgi:hypothetical protein